MARRVFISFLGTNNYVTCKYVINGQVSSPLRFVQEALIAHLCKDWDEKDRICIFCTSKEKTGEVGSKEINWLDDGHGKIWEEIERIGLAHRLNDLKERIGLKPQIEEVDIEAGFSEEEIWNIFQTVYSKLLLGDEIHFDVTHAFRSIPLFSVVLFNYSKFMLGTKIVSIQYGAFEKLGPAYKVREIPMEKRVAQVIDLTNIVRLQEYNQQASNLKEYGRVKQLGEMVGGTQDTVSDSTIRDLSNSIKQLDEYIATIDLQNIRKGAYMAAFRNNYKGSKKKFIAPIRNILDELYKETAEFEAKQSWKNIEAAINWTILHEMLAQTYPLTEEYICLRLSHEFDDLKPKELSRKKYRIFISDIMGMPEESFQNQQWGGSLIDYPDVADDLAQEAIIQELRPVYDIIRQVRNSLAHGNGAVKYDEVVATIPKVLKCVGMLNEEYNQYPSTISIKKMYGI